MADKSFWHYTTIEALAGILHCGKILSSPGVEPNERPGVWVSINKTWEHTARHRALFDPKTGEIEKRFDHIGMATDTASIPARLKINTSNLQPISFKTHCQIGNICKKYIDCLIKRGKEFGGNPDDWYIIYHDVPINCIIRPIEFFPPHKLKWTPLPTMLEIKIKRQFKQIIQIPKPRHHERIYA